jgi:hypothetical protein
MTPPFSKGHSQQRGCAPSIMTAMAGDTKLKMVKSRTDVAALFNDMSEGLGKNSEPPSCAMGYIHPWYATVLSKPNAQSSLDGLNNCYTIYVS